MTRNRPIDRRVRSARSYLLWSPRRTCTAAAAAGGFLLAVPLLGSIDWPTSTRAATPATTAPTQAAAPAASPTASTTPTSIPAPSASVSVAAPILTPPLATGPHDHREDHEDETPDPAARAAVEKTAVAFVRHWLRPGQSAVIAGDWYRGFESLAHPSVRKYLDVTPISSIPATTVQSATTEMLSSVQGVTRVRLADGTTISVTVTDEGAAWLVTLYERAL